MHRRLAFLFLGLLSLFLLSACSSAIPNTELAGGDEWTNIDEIDHVIRIALSGDTAALRSIVQFTQSKCTNAKGLGGPPKCVEGEIEGDAVEVLPFLGVEGFFIRKEDIGSWKGLDVSNVYAVYTVSELAYTDPDYPRGTHAIVLTGKGEDSAVTLQITNGQIARIDFMFGEPPVIREVDVESYLLSPQPTDA